MTTSGTSNAARGFEDNIDAEESCFGVPQSIVCDQNSTSPDVASLSTPSTDNLVGDDDFTGLISMLVVRLLSKIQTQTDLYPTDVTRTSQDLIPKVIAAFCAWSGCSETQAYPKNLKSHKVYSTVYKHLLKEFGSEKILQLAVSTQDSTFNRILVKSLSKELLHSCNEASRAASRTSFEATRPEALLMAEDVKATRGKLSFLQRLARLKFNLKPFMMGNKKNSRHSESKDQTTAEEIMLAHPATFGLPEGLPSTSQQEKPRKRPLLIRMFSTISIGLSKPFKRFYLRHQQATHGLVLQTPTPMAQEKAGGHLLTHVPAISFETDSTVECTSKRTPEERDRVKVKRANMALMGRIKSLGCEMPIMCDYRIDHFPLLKQQWERQGL
ncbi:uncharacterized protein LOC118964655 [Oncorhynchus mykiss]|uniref:uncharacterized protein LOC118964655 n=1 Tax=Oncorhynchus mykiss TaxID=8022 RepID=UPI00187878CD|nr:uncharacterized protein LOC118964655 [Oncorhynchus mykiss]